MKLFTTKKHLAQKNKHMKKIGTLLKILIICAGIEMNAMELVKPEPEPSQIFLGHWENNTPYTISFEDISVDFVAPKLLAELPPDPNNKKFLGLNASLISKENIWKRKFHIKPKDNEYVGVWLKIDKKISNELVRNHIYGIHHYKKYVTFFENRFKEGMRIFIHGTLQGEHLEHSKFSCRYKPLKVLSLKELAIGAVIENNFPIYNLPADIKEAIATFKREQEEQEINFCKKPRTLSD